MYANSGRGGRGGGRGRGAAGSGGGFSGKGRGFPPAKGNGNFSGGGKGKGKGGKGGKGKDRGVFVPQLPLKERNAEVDRKDAIFGYEKLDKTVTAGTEYVGWMTNFRTVTVEEEDGSELSAVEYYFIGPDGSGFKALQTAQPYMYISVAPGTENEVEAALRRTFPVEVRPASAVARTAAAAGRMGSQEPGGGLGWGWGALRTRRQCCAEHTRAHHSAPQRTTALTAASHRLPRVRAAQGRAAEDAGGPHAAQPPVRPAQEVPTATLRQLPRPDDRSQDDTAPQHAHTRPQRRSAAAPPRRRAWAEPTQPPHPPHPLPTPPFPLGSPAVHKNPPTPSAPPHHLDRPAVHKNRAKRDATAAYADEARPTPDYP